MSSVRVVLMVVVAAGIGVSCGGGDRLVTDDADASLAESREVSEPLPAGVNPPAAATAQPMAAAATVQLEQPAVWPAADVVFDTPEEAAADFMGDYLDERPGGVLSEFRPGDSRSGEIDVEYIDEVTGEDGVLSTLLMRQLGPNDGWFVLAAVNERVTITSPESGSTIAPGPVTVEGIGQGHESTIHVSAYPAGDHNQLDVTFTSGGLYEPAPYSATLDLSAAPPGFVAIQVSGDSGRTNDMGPTAVIPVNIGLPGTR
jgi:hypothetical protein